MIGPRAVLDRLQAACDRSVGPRRSVHYDLAGTRVRLDFVGVSPAVFEPALRHARTAPGAPDLVVTVCDDTVGPDPMVAAIDTSAAADGVRVLVSACTTVALDATAGRGVCHVRDADALPPWERGRPLRALFGWWAGRRGLQLAHGAAVGTAHGAVLLVGSGGSGKSTAAATAWLAGMPFLGDDQVVVGGHPPRVYPLYASVAATPDDLRARLSGLPEVDAAAADGDKTHCFLPTRVSGPLPLVAVAACRVGPATGWRRASAVETLLSVAAQSLLWVPGDRQAGLARLGALVSATPTFAVSFGPDPAETVDVLRAIAEAAGA